MLCGIKVSLRHNSLNTNSNISSGPETDAIAKKLRGSRTGYLSGRKSWELLLFYLGRFLQAKGGARNPNLQVLIAHASHVCSQHSFGLPLRVNGMHIKQFDHSHLDRLSLGI